MQEAMLALIQWEIKCSQKNTQMSERTLAQLLLSYGPVASQQASPPASSNPAIPFQTVQQHQQNLRQGKNR